jgi:FkbM family methyltransferase
MKPLLFLNKVFNKLSRTNLKLSFSQCGEDAILLFVIHALQLKQIQYFDIGTNDPRNMNNTYLLYLHNYRGVCIEPDPSFHKTIKKYRPGDILIPAGVAVNNEKAAEFYVMDDPLLNTFSLTEAEKLVSRFNRKIKDKIAVELISINEIFEKYYKKTGHNILSLDVEGLDLSILQAIDYKIYKPSIICVENIEFSDNLSGKKDLLINTFLMAQGYTLYADTYINSIFIDCNLLKTTT